MSDLVGLQKAELFTPFCTLGLGGKFAEQASSCRRAQVEIEETNIASGVRRLVEYGRLPQQSFCIGSAGGE